MTRAGSRTACTARAPGKLVWLGEYAVLEGAPAAVCAVDRYAVATARAVSGPVCSVIAANLPDARLDFECGASELSWRRRVGPLDLAAGIVAELHARGRLADVEPFEIRLDTARLYAADGKLGLGSSAAAGVALWRVLQSWSGSSDSADGHLHAEFAWLDRLHRRVQGGGGSGVDVAAALFGGLNRFERGGANGAPCIGALSLPSGLRWCAVYTGRPASTPALLARLQAWRDADADGYQRHLDGLARIARDGTGALAGCEVAAFRSAVDEYRRALAALGAAAGMDIVSAEHRGLAELAARHGVAYKPSGAGGGDLGLGFADDPEALAAWRDAVVTAGFLPVALEPAPRAGAG